MAISRRLRWWLYESVVARRSRAGAPARKYQFLARFGAARERQRGSSSLMASISAAAARA